MTDKLLEKDVKKNKLTSEDADAIKSRVKTVQNMKALGDHEVDLVMEVCRYSPWAGHV